MTLEKITKNERKFRGSDVFALLRIIEKDKNKLEEFVGNQESGSQGREEFHWIFCEFLGIFGKVGQDPGRGSWLWKELMVR